MNTLDDRFWRKVDKRGQVPQLQPALGPCWEWMGTRTDRGYGVFKINGHNRRAHRVLWEDNCGALNNGIELDHLCQNRGCVRPSHLEPVTHSEHMSRSARARQTHCWRGHALADDNIRFNGGGSRVCKQCALLRERMRRQHLPRRNKLKPEDVYEIREWWARVDGTIYSGSRGNDTISAVARKYRVGRSAIQRIVNGSGWRSLDPKP